MRRKRKIDRIYITAAVPMLKSYALFPAAFDIPRFGNSEIAKFQILRRVKIIYKGKYERFFRSVRNGNASIVVSNFYGKSAEVKTRRAPLFVKQLSKIFVLVATERAFAILKFCNGFYRIFSVFVKIAVIL